MESMNGAFLDLVPPTHLQDSQPNRPRLRNVSFNSNFYADGTSCCHICTQTFQIDDEIASHESCGQQWHSDCLKLRIQRYDACPWCREVIRDRKAPPKLMCKYNDGVYRDLMIAFNRAEATARRQTVKHQAWVNYLSGLEHFLQTRIRFETKFDFMQFGPHPGEHPDVFDELIGVVGVPTEYYLGIAIVDAIW